MIYSGLNTPYPRFQDPGRIDDSDGESECQASLNDIGESAIRN